MDDNKQSHLNENNLQFLEEEVIHYSSGEEDFLSDNKINSFPLIASNNKNTNSQCQQRNFNQEKDALNKLAAKEKGIGKEVITLQKKVITLNNQLLKKTNALSQIEHELNSIKQKYHSILKELTEEKDKNIDLSYINIELKQKITTLDSAKAFNNRLLNKELSNPSLTNSLNEYNTNEHHQQESISKIKESFLEKEQMYEIELLKLTNQIEELEISKSKLQFENKTLNLKLINAEEDKQSELLLLTSIKDNEINNSKKTIDALNNQLTSSLSSSSSSKKTQNANNDYSPSLINKISNKHFIDQLTEIDKRNKDLDKENFQLKKQNNSLQNEITDFNIRIKNKDLIISQLQNGLDKRILEYKHKLKEFNEDVNRAISSEELLIHLDSLSQEKNMLIRKNEELENGLIELNNNIKVANEMFSDKYNEFESEMNIERYRNKAYKRKIELLKLKVNELYNEITVMKREKGYFKECNYNHSGVFTPHLLSTSNSIKSNCIRSKRHQCVHLNSNTGIINTRIKDPLYISQQHSIEKYKKTLKLVDNNLKKYI